MTAAQDVPTFEAVPSSPVPASRPHFVKEDEDIVWVGKPVLRAVASQAGGMIFAFVFFFAFGTVGAFTAGGGGTAALAVLFIFVVFLLIGVLPVLQLRRMVYVITDSGAYTRAGIFGERVNQTSFEKITDINYSQDVIGRLFGYGTLSINTAGSTSNALTMMGLPNALEVKRMIERAKGSRYASRSRPTGWTEIEDLPVFVPKDQVAQIRCVSCAMIFKRPRVEVGGPGTCPHCGHGFQLAEVQGDGDARRN